MGKIYAAKTNHITNPIGFNMDTIAFSWKVKGCRGQNQKHARIVISKNKTFTDICYDTGETELDSLSTRVEFEIQPYTRYYWKVIVATDVEEVIESDVQFFETAKMDEPWTGRWITCDSSQERHPIFSKRIEPKKKVKRARLYICGLESYEAYFLGESKENPEKIGDEYLTPYCNNYDQWIQYQTYDITKQAEQGGVLSVLLGNGWYKGRFGFNDPEREAYYGDEWKLIAEIHIEYKDGTKDVISSDETWSVTRSNLWFSNIYDGERRDDTLPPVEESPARIAKVPKGRLMERLSLPVKVQEEMKPAELIHTPAGEDVFDLGQEIAGIFRLRVHEPAGTTIRIQTGEVLQDGCFYNENLRTALSEYIYVSDGTEKVITPHFTYYGYRYVKVTGIRDLSCEDFTALVLYSDYESIGAIETGNDLVNKLISNIEWGMKGNFLDVPTDCPQRDERMGWTGDAQVFSATASYLADTYAFYRKYLYDMYQEQLLADGMVPEILRAVLDTDGKRAHLVTPFLEQLLFAEEADILWQVLLLGDAWHCLDEEWREKVRASFREKTAAPDAWSREWTKSLLQEWAVYVTEDRQLLLAGDPIVLHSAYLNQNMEEAVRKHAFVPVYMPLSEYLWFLAAESGRKIPQHFTEQLHEFMQIYRGVYGSWKQPDERLQEIREKFPLVHGANLRYLCSLMEQELPRGKGMILVSPEYANYASVMEMLRTGSKYPLLHARADGNEEAEEVERREIFLGLLEQ